MKIENIKAIIWNDLCVLKRVKWRLIELIYFPLSMILIWGMFALYNKNTAPEAGMIVLMVNLFWIFSMLVQQQGNILMMEDLWSSNIRNLLTAGITEFEYLTAKLTMSTILATIVGTGVLFIANAFGAPLLANLTLVLKLAGIALIGSIAIAIMIAGTVIRVGKEYAFLSWTVLEALIFLSAPFYSREIFPTAIRWITEIMPFTYLFQTARTMTGTPDTSMMMYALIVVIVYLLISIPYFKWSYNRARKTGMLARIST